MRIIEWLGGLMFLIAAIDFAANPKAALKSIPEVLQTNARIENGHLVVPSHRNGQ